MQYYICYYFIVSAFKWQKLSVYQKENSLSNVLKFNYKNKGWSKIFEILLTISKICSILTKVYALHSHKIVKRRHFKKTIIIKYTYEVPYFHDKMTTIIMWSACILIQVNYSKNNSIKSFGLHLSVNQTE